MAASVDWSCEAKGQQENREIVRRPRGMTWAEEPEISYRAGAEARAGLRGLSA